jgi:hypothetical protein
MADIKVRQTAGFKILAQYDNDNGENVTNELGVNFYVGLTLTDGETEDKEQKKLVRNGETVSYPSGLGAGRNVIFYEATTGSQVRPINVYVK